MLIESLQDQCILFFLPIDKRVEFIIDNFHLSFISLTSVLGMAFCPRRHKMAHKRESMDRIRLVGLRQGIPVVIVLLIIL